MRVKSTLLKPAIIFIVLVWFAVAGALKYSKTSSSHYERALISIANASLSVDIPLTRAGFSRGLGGRDALAENEGMLFLCLPDPYQKFWMKEMSFPIDIVWIDERFTVLGVTHRVSPESFPDVFTPARPAAHVLEVNAGVAEKYGITAGAMVFGLGGDGCR